MSTSINLGNRLNGGFSLVELMIALAAGLIVSSALVAFMMSSFRSNADYVQSTRLTQELRNSLDLVTRDLRRASYNEKSMSLIASGNPSPFSPMLMNGECVIYAYDRANGTPGAVDVANGEVRGIRRIVNANGVGVIEYAESSTATGKPTCAGTKATYTNYPPSCSDNGWCALSDPSILNITALTLADNRVAAASPQISVRDIGITITGQLANSTLITRTVTDSVRIRSDCFIPSPNPSGFSCITTP